MCAPRAEPSIGSPYLCVCCFVLRSEASNLQDGCVVHVGDANGTTVGQQTVVGHRAVLHGCRVGDGVIVGMQVSSVCLLLHSTR